MVNAKTIIVYLTKKHDGNWNQIYEDIRNKVQIDSEEAEKTDLTGAITIIDEEYPTALRNAPKPPFAFFTEGNAEILKDEIEFLILPKEPTEYEKKALRLVIGKAQERGISTMTVKMGEIEIVRPNGETLKIRFQDTATSEVCKHARYWASAIATDIVIVGIRKNSASLMVIAPALDLGKDIYAVPHQIGEDDECNRLISQGAIPWVE